MEFVDTHAHLYLDQFDEDRNEVIKRAFEKGVKKIILPNIDSGSIESLNRLCSEFQNICLPLIGLHPTSVKENYRDELKLVSEAFNKTYYGIGEIGIDLYWDKTFLKEQKEVFDIQINLAIENNLPIVVHARESFREIFDILENYKGKALNGVFHAFTGSIEQARYIINNFNFYLGIGGIVSFKKSGVDNVVKIIGTDHIVLETDSPYLSPVPFRGKRNESSYIYFIAEKIADISNLSLEKIAEITTRNAYNLFRIN